MPPTILPRPLRNSLPFRLSSSTRAACAVALREAPRILPQDRRDFHRPLEPEVGDPIHTVPSPGGTAGSGCQHPKAVIVAQLEHCKNLLHFCSQLLGGMA